MVVFAGRVAQAGLEAWKAGRWTMPQAARSRLRHRQLERSFHAAASVAECRMKPVLLLSRASQPLDQVPSLRW
ncbi:hypothetical protein [Streptomyces sp. 769]|uniref:hypothetical protein n=1 Tax=Streptomyces sp. 769 TaxID=1262452 RepID=UPI0005821356|nr:hypothetical protein [Streptomyces sp. 769]AJC62113.1 hypothetical protein GZL_p00183 [Streptomyces sp. 769]